MNTLAELYKEVSTKLKQDIPSINWIDLWHNQVGFLSEEFPFNGPAVFLAFRTTGTIENQSLHVQSVPTQVDCYCFHETFLESYEGAPSQDGAIAFLELLTDVHKCLHGSSGEVYNEMSRIVAWHPVDTGSAQNLYRVSFTCMVHDASAKPEEEEAPYNGITVERGEQEQDEDEPLWPSI